MNFTNRLVPVPGAQLALAVTSATPVSLTVPAGAMVAVIKAETAAVRWRDDGSAPTTTLGMPMAATDAPLDYAGNLSAMQFIAQSTSATIDVLYYKLVG